MSRKFREIFTENLSAKFVALFISFILWVTILGRRDFVQTKEVDVELLTSSDYQVSQQDIERIRVRASGPRAALRKFMENQGSHTLLIDISTLKDGKFEIKVPAKKIETPLGVKVLSVRPSQIHATVVKKEKPDGKENDND